MSVEENWNMLGEQARRLWSDTTCVPDGSIVIPVNAQTDLGEVWQVLTDIVRYQGERSLEILLVINNFLSQSPPREVDAFREAGVTVVAVPDLRQLVGEMSTNTSDRLSGEDPATVTELHRAGLIMAARIFGLERASAENVIFLDADSRLPAPTALINWFLDQLSAGAQLAHVRVRHFDLPPGLSVRVRIALHHLANWGKRAVFGIPTTRGGDFAVRRTLMLQLYAKGLLLDDMSVGSAVKSVGGKVVYAGDASDLSIVTSGRTVEGGWRNTIWYFWWRLGYNKRVLTRDVSEGESGCG